MTAIKSFVLVAGEASGDQLGSALMRALKSRYPDAVFTGVGGPAMIAEGLQPWFDMERLSVNGFSEPLKRLPELIRIFRGIKRRVLDQRSDCFIGIDFNFFNLLLEGSLKKAGIRTVHYVSPSVWAWRSGRIRRIKQNVDLMLTLYPFETQIYHDHDIPARFVGHPKAQQIEVGAGRANQTRVRQQRGIGNSALVIAVLPGSRASEVKLSLPDFIGAMTRLVQKRPGAIFLIAAANANRKRQIERILSEHRCNLAVTVSEGDALDVMTAADGVLVNSGTATLEAMLLGKPMVMAYRLGWLTYQIVSRLVNIDYFALPNILSGKYLVPELLQDQANADDLADALCEVLEPARQAVLISEFATIHETLRGDLVADAVAPIEALISSGGRIE
jgi:lipid-A-disaccharide synthase